MYKQSMIKLLFLIGILSGCTAIAHENQPDPTLINTSVHTIASTETSIVPDISSTPSRTTIPTLLPTPPATPSPIIEPTVTISMSEDFQIIDLCGTIYSDTTTIDTSFLAGIVTQDIDQKTDYVTVLSQKDEVAFRWNVPAGDWTATASPDGQWLAATFYDSFDTDGNATVVMVKVINPYTGESYQLQLDSELIQLYAGALLEFDWLSNESLYISKLDGVDPLFGGMLEMHYFVWSPFIGETTEFTVPLPDYVYMQIEPTLDPLLEYVTYSCESHLTCKQDILRVWDIFSGTLAWSVEKGFAHGFPDAGVWSWNGQMVAIFNVQDAQETVIQVFSRDGKLLYETRVPGEVSSKSATWAPNNEFLSFTYWSDYDKKGHFVIFDLAHGTVIRYCQGEGEVWSPNSSMTIYDGFIDKGDYFLYYAYALDISNGDVYLWRESNYFIEIYGWVNPVSQ